MNFFDINTILYLVSNLFRIYVLTKIIGIYFINVRNDKKIGFLAFTLYFILNSVVYLFFSSPLLNLIINLVMLFTLTFTYKSKFSTRLIASVLTYAVNMLLESVIFNLFAKVPALMNREAVTRIIEDIVLFLIVLIFEQIFGERKMHRNKIERMYIAHWIAILLIPTSSIMIVVTGFLSNYNATATILIVSSLLGINVLVFYLYDVLEEYYDNKYEKGILKQQINAYANELEIKKASENNIKMLRHDMKNHISIMQNMLLNDKTQELLHYINSTYEHIDVKKEYVNSGNSEIDSVLNYKIAETENIGAIIDISVNVPDKLRIEPYDLNVILGNLIDNAVAAIKESDEKVFKIKIDLDRSVLYIKVTNSYSGKIQRKDERFLTTKKDTQNHGVGLSSIENILDKYDGTMDIDYNDGTFEVNILIYNPAL